MKQEYELESQDVSLMASYQYMREVRQMERLTADEEARLLRFLERSKSDPENQWLASVARHARERLVEAYQPVVVANAQKLASLALRRKIELLDLIQDGNIGLLEAIEVHRAGKGRSLRSLASVCVRRAMLYALRDHDGLIHVPGYIRRVLAEMYRAKERLEMQLGREPSFGEIAAEIGVKEDVLRSYVQYDRCGQPESIQELLFDDEDEDRRVFASVFGGSERSETRYEQLRQAIEELSPRQREVLKLRYGLEEGAGDALTQEAIAQRIGGSKGVVGCYERRAKDMLRRKLAPLYIGSQEEVAV